MVHLNAPLFARTAAAGVRGHQVLPTTSHAPLQPLQSQPQHELTAAAAAAAAGNGAQKSAALVPTKPGMVSGSWRLHWLIAAVLSLLCAVCACCCG